MGPLLFRVGLKVMAKNNLVYIVAVGRVEMPYRMIMKESRLTTVSGKLYGNKNENGRKAA